MKLLIHQLHQLKQMTKLKEKEETLRTLQDDELFLFVANYLADDRKIVGISTKKLAKPIPAIERFTTLPELITYLLAHPTGSDEEIGYIKGFLRHFPEDQQEVLSEIITKTWSMTVGAKLLNKVYGKGFVPEFSCQLAHSYDKKQSQVKDDDEYAVTKKLDGHRAICVVQNHTITFYSRTGKEMEGMSKLTAHMKDWLVDNAIQGDYVFDGELLSMDESLSTGERFQQTSQLISTKGETTGVAYHIFDTLPLSEFYEGVSSLPYRKRREGLDTYKGNQTIRILPMLAVIQKDSIPYWSNVATENGWEGVMLNRMDGYYQTKRHNGLLKVKGMKTADLPIVGFNQAIDGKFKGKLQSIEVALDDKHTVSVGSGLTEEIREQIWNNPSSYLGMMVEIQYFEQTKNQHGEYSLRFPVFKQFRPDKTIEDRNVD